MTISYSAEVANCSSFGCFWRILCKWKGSVYKLIWRELLAYLVLYFVINIVYRYGLHEPEQRIFEKIRHYFGQQGESIPMSFVLGFYVSLIVKRWWEQYRLLPWPDSLALFVSAAIPGVDERGRLMRRNIVRYAMLSYVITLQKVSFRVKKRFPTWQHMVDAGLMMESEKKIFEMMDEKTEMSKYWMPLIWATNIINRARKESLIPNDHVVQTILMELSDIRRRLGSLIGYDTVCVPLVYTQVVTLSVYTYFIAALMGRQFVQTDPTQYPDMFFPFFTVLQFCFYIGWLKVAEVLINPFGEDDDDIELNWLIDRHVKAAYMIVDEMHEEHPELLKDQYWEEVVPKDLPYTVASEHYRRTEPKGSAENFRVKEADSLYANLLPSRKAAPDDVYADYESVDTPLVERRKNWFQRQLNRMGSVRSSSTTYSSGLFGRGRHNSVYSSPEAGPPGPPGATNPVLQHKMSLYDRLVGRKSGRGQHRNASRQGTTKMNGSAVPVALKNRPRIPTPDVTKEVVDRENKLMGGASPGAMAGHHHHHHLHHPSYPAELPVVQVVLSPIQELESGSGAHHHHQGGQGGTAALAQAVLSPALTTAGIGAVTLATTPVSVAMGTMTLAPITMSQPLLTSLGLGTAQPAVTLTEVNSASEEESAPTEDRSRKASVASQSNAAKRGEVYV
ncbi:bestrophin-4 [Periplaneta americana]|uniref:bestrophin-4 n=1 Tax=Periplaneta americana TaxID=6978 RepID=UPI0037E89C76